MKSANQKARAGELSKSPARTAVLNFMGNLMFVMDKFNVKKAEALEMSDLEVTFAKAYEIASSNKNALAQKYLAEMMN